MIRLLTGIMLSILLCHTPLPVAAGELPAAVVDGLTASRFAEKGEAIDQLARSGHPQSRKLLTALADGQLYFMKRDKRLVILDRSQRPAVASDALSGEPLGEVRRGAAKKVTINNRLRSQIQSALATIDLHASDPARRLAAVSQMLDRPDPGNATLVAAVIGQESDPGVREVMALVVALAEVSHPQRAKREAAVALLADSLHPAVRHALQQQLTTSSDPEFRRLIERSLARIDARLELFAWIENLFFGLSLGSVLVLAAIGLAITFGVMGVINMAHGELIMLGAYTTYVMQLLLPDHPGWSLAVAVPAAFMVSALVGIAIERGVIRFLYGRPLETLLATFGISLILQQAVRTIFSPLNRSVSSPEWMSGTLEINSALSFTYNRLTILIFSLAVFALLFLILKYSRLGLQVRAVSQNRPMARAMGVRSEWVDAMTFGLGSGIAGVAGVALSQLTNVGPNLGQAYIIDSFMVVVFGGVGNLWGTLVSGMTLGVANKFLEPWSGAVLAKILVLVFIILFIQKRPRGLFPQRGRAAEG